MEPGSAPGTVRFSLTTLYGSDFEGGHFSRSGTTADGRTAAVPLYRHDVSLDYTRVELELQYTATPDWEISLRVPWERKAQTSGARVVDAATADEMALMQRNMELHHRSGTFEGISDLMLLGRRRWSSVWRDGDSLSLSGGATLPTGRTVENPYLLGDRGVQHLHIQFGTGTVDPLLEASYSAPLRPRLSAGAYAAGRAPLYENKRGFQGPPEASFGLSLSHRTTERLQFRLEGGAFMQGYGYWDGLRDENTGLIATNATLGTSIRVGASTLSADLRVPLSQRTLTEGDAFTQGPTVVVAVSGFFRRPDRKSDQKDITADQ